MDRRWIVFGVFLLLVLPFAAAQTATSTLADLWDHVTKLEKRVDVLAQDLVNTIANLNGLSSNFSSYQTQTNQDIQVLHDAAGSLQTQLGETNDTVQTNQEQTQQQIDALNQTDQNLQGQINGLNAGMNRSHLYEVTGTGFPEILVYCRDKSDILMDSYCAGGFLGDLSVSQSVLGDDFSDGDYSQNPAWFVGSGSWSAASTALIGSNFPGGSIYSFVNMPSGLTYQMRFTIQQNNVSTLGSFKWFTSQGNYFSNGYDLAFYDSHVIALEKWVNGNEIQLTTLGTFQQGVVYDVLITHHPNGLIEVIINGTLAGTFTDTTYTSGNLVSFWTGNGGGTFTMDNVSISNDANTVTTGGFLNVSDTNSPMGIKCNHGWEARIICYSPN